MFSPVSCFCPHALRWLLMGGFFVYMLSLCCRVCSGGVDSRWKHIHRFQLSEPGGAEPGPAKESRVRAEGQSTTWAHVSHAVFFALFKRTN